MKLLVTVLCIVSSGCVCTVSFERLKNDWVCSPQCVSETKRVPQRDYAPIPPPPPFSNIPHRTR